MRTVPAERHKVKRILQDEGRTVIEITRPRPSQLDLFPQGVITLTTWCEQHIGTGQIEPGERWLDNGDVWYMFEWYGFWSFHFKHGRDATAFALRFAK